MKERILRSSLWLFNRYGIKAVTMDDISSRLKISKRTLYKHFQSREELLFSCVQYRIEEQEIFDCEQGKPLLDALCRAYRQIAVSCRTTNIVCLRDIEKHYPSVHSYIIEHVIDYTTVLKSKVIDAIEQGDLRCDINPELVSSFLKDYFIRLFTINENEQTIPYKTYSPDIFLLFIRGISTTKGIRHINELIGKQQDKQ